MIMACTSNETSPQAPNLSQFVPAVNFCWNVSPSFILAFDGTIMGPSGWTIPRFATSSPSPDCFMIEERILMGALGESVTIIVDDPHKAAIESKLVVLVRGFGRSPEISKDLILL